mmetsp:Transcript_41710/g.54938  ORF Transcript_41710/g.54938 Transcript_41710/m.54938 type:complete len:98 (-) Transcript_41710:479-772(-)
MRKSGKTYTDTRRSIRSFYLAPVFGLTLTFLVPHLYFWYVVIGPSPGLFKSGNGVWAATVIIEFIVDVIALCFMGYQAHKIRERIGDATHSYIVRSL